jgi:hypothetical protein
MNTAKVLTMNQERHSSVDPFGLRELSPVAPDQDGWPEIRAELERRNGHRRMVAWAGSALAAAATLVLAINVFVGEPLFAPDSAPDSGAIGTVAGVTASNQTADEQTDSSSDADGAPEATVDSLISLSQQLEERLRLYRDELGDLPANTVVYQVELEDLVVQVDSALSLHPESRALWGQRVNLLLDLNRLYENYLRRDYYRLASL